MTKRIIIFLTSLIFFTGAFLNAQNSKTLIVYFSWGGNTRVAAENTKRLTGADIFEITVKNPFLTNFFRIYEKRRKALFLLQNKIQAEGTFER